MTIRMLFFFFFFLHFFNYLLGSDRRLWDFFNDLLIVGNDDVFLAITSVDAVLVFLIDLLVRLLLDIISDINE